MVQAKNGADIWAIIWAGIWMYNFWLALILESQKNREAYFRSK